MKRLFTYGAALGAVFVLFCLTLSPYLMNGFWNDDCLNSGVAGWQTLTGQSPWDLSWRINSEWIRNEGRLLPLGFLYGYHVFHWFQSVEYYRLFQMSVVLVQIGLFSWLVSKLADSARLAAVAAFILLMLFQIRDYHDPLASYAGLPQIVGLCMIGSALLLAKYFRTKRAWHLTLALLPYSAGLLVYELTVTALPLLWFIAPPRTSIKRRLSALLPYLVLTGMYFAVTLRLRHTAPGAYAGIAPSLDWKKWCVAFGQQVFASLPLSYWTAILREHMHAKDILYQTFGSWSGWAVFGGNMVLFGVLLRKSATMYRHGFGFRRGGQLVAVGLVLLVCPAAMIAMTKKYQDQLHWGIGYLPVSISYLGVALLAAVAMFWLLARVSLLPARFKKLVVHSIVIGAGALVAMNRTVNIAVAKQLDAAYKGPRELVEAAAQVGVFDSLTTGDVLLAARAPQWLNVNLLSQHARHAIKPVLLTHVSDAKLDDLLTTHRGNVFLLDYRDFPEADRGWLMLSQLNPAGLKGSSLKGSPCKAPSIGYSLFVKSDHQFQTAPVGRVRFLPVKPNAPNMLRRIYDAGHDPRYYALAKVVGTNAAPCAKASGELDFKRIGGHAAQSP